jgi:hypothetical protein
MYQKAQQMQNQLLVQCVLLVMLQTVYSSAGSVLGPKQPHPGPAMLQEADTQSWQAVIAPTAAAAAAVLGISTSATGLVAAAGTSLQQKGWQSGSLARLPACSAV